MMSVSRFWSDENRSSIRHSEASRSWSRLSVVNISLRIRLASFPLMRSGFVGVSCWRAQPVTNIDSPISNPTRVWFSGSSEVSSISYSTVTWSVHVFRCFCNRSSPTLVLDSSSRRSPHSSSCSGFSRSGIQKLVPRPGCGTFQQISYSREVSRSNFPARFTKRVVVVQFVCVVRVVEFRDGGFEGVFRLVRQVVRRHHVVGGTHRRTVLLEGVVECVSVFGQRLLEALLFAPSGWCERGFQRLIRRLSR